jgi:hypothetical protein
MIERLIDKLMPIPPVLVIKKALGSLARRLVV